jgi:hypothetical protein
MPFWLSFGVGAPAKEPSPRKSGPSSHFEICAASRIVKGLTRTATVIDEASLEIAMVFIRNLKKVVPPSRRKQNLGTRGGQMSKYPATPYADVESKE